MRYKPAMNSIGHVLPMSMPKVLPMCVPAAHPSPLPEGEGTAFDGYSSFESQWFQIPRIF
jgi:hypothetical protein